MALNIHGWKSDNHEATDDYILRTEKILGVKLPNSYIELMKEWNGGELQEEYQILVKGSVPEQLDYYLGEGFWGISSISGISDDICNSYSITNTAQTAHEWGAPKDIIAFDGDGHTWVAFDYRDRGLEEPKIVFFESDNCEIFILCDSFSDFISEAIPYDQVYDSEGNIIY